MHTVAAASEPRNFCRERYAADINIMSVTRAADSRHTLFLAGGGGGVL